MALQVWLPLNGNLNNQGIANIPITLHRGTTSFSSGNLGQALSCDGASDWRLTNINLGNEATIACWSKFSETVTGSKMPWVLECNVSIYLNLFVTTTKYVLNVGDGSQNPFLTPSGDTISSLRDGIWHHLAVVFGSGQVKLYIDGTYAGAATTFRSPACTNGALKLAGDFNGTSEYNWNGQICDFRVYDHALSGREVKEIAKGLIVHYPLNDSDVYAEPDGSRWIQIAHHNNPASGKLFNSTDDFSNRVYLDPDRWYNIESVTSRLSSFEFLVKQKTTATAAEVKYRWIQSKSPAAAAYADVAPDAVTRVTTSGYTDGGYGGLYIRNSNTRAVIANDTSTNWYGAFGSWTAYSGGIPGYPNTTVTTGYMDLYVRIDNVNNPDQFYTSKVLDCSGLGNNGTVMAGALSTDNSSPRYQKSTYFNGSTYIQGKSLTAGVAQSAVFWLYVPASIPTGGVILFLERTSQLAFGYWNGTMLVACSVNCLSQFPTTALRTNAWNHICILRPVGSANPTLYVNGALQTNNGTQDNWGGSGDLFTIGKRTDSGYNAYPFTGSISDFRLYATVLSVEDILELYNTPISVCKNGDLMCLEAVEVTENSATFSKKGLATEISLIESGSEVRSSKSGNVCCNNLVEY